MKNVLLLGLLFPIWSIAQSYDPTGSKKQTGVHFIEQWNWEQVKKKAKQENKFIFVDCYATWCGPCRQMDRMTYPDDSVGIAGNGAFLSIKVQCDSTKNDGDDARDHYAEASYLVHNFRVTEYPTLLFFSPNGELVHKSVGYLPPRKFIDLLSEAQNPETQFFTLFHVFQKGKLDFDKMLMLAKIARGFNDEKLYSSISRKYIEGYLDRLPESAFSTRNTFEQIGDFIGVVNSGDKVFEWLLRNPKIGDSLMKQDHYSEILVHSVIYSEVMAPGIRRAKETNIAPKWDSLGQVIASKFGREHMGEPILKGKMRWYEFVKDWENYVDAGIKRFELAEFPGKAQYLELLNNFAYTVFQRSQDSQKLEEALSWLTAVNVRTSEDAMPHLVNYLDTKANLLYKLKRKDEALTLEVRASNLRPESKEIKEVIQKMAEGKPTW